MDQLAVTGSPRELAAAWSAQSRLNIKQSIRLAQTTRNAWFANADRQGDEEVSVKTPQRCVKPGY